MAPNVSSDMSVSMAAALRTITPAANLATSITFADQRRSPLMALPKELRNRIYSLVLNDDAYTHKPTVYYWDHKRNTTIGSAHLPKIVRLDHFSRPPSSDCILACRQLQAEMKQMHAAALQAYWASNCFIYSHEMSQPQNNKAFPSDKIIARIEHFVIDFDHKWYFYMSFDGLQWDSKLLPARGHKPLEDDPFRGVWTLSAQSTLQDMVRDYQAGGRWLSLNPHGGRGFTRDKLMALERRGDVAMCLGLVRESRVRRGAR